MDVSSKIMKKKNGWDTSTDPQPGQIQDGRHFKGKFRKMVVLVNGEWWF